MAKSNETDIIELLLKGHKRGIQKAIDIASRTNTSLIVQKGDKIVAVKPKYKYIRVAVNAVKKKAALTSRRKVKSRT